VEIKINPKNAKDTPKNVLIKANNNEEVYFEYLINNLTFHLKNNKRSINCTYQLVIRKQKG